MDASPRSNRLTTQPRAIMGQCSMVRYTPKATNSPSVMRCATTSEPPSHSTSAAPAPMRSWMPG